MLQGFKDLTGKNKFDDCDGDISGNIAGLYRKLCSAVPMSNWDPNLEKAQNNVLAHVHRLKMAELWAHKHVRIPETCKYLTWQKGFADVIELRILRRGDYPGLSGGTTYNHVGPYKMEIGESKRGDVTGKQRLG